MLAAIGALVQLAGVLLLAVLLLALRRYADVRGYFGPWTSGWAVYAIALLAVVLRYIVAPRLTSTPEPLANALCDAVYVGGKLLFYVTLWAGAARYAGRPGRVGRLAVAALGYAAIAFAFTEDLNGIIVWQAPLAAGASLAAAVLLIGAPKRRPTVGSLVTGTSCSILAGLWSLYGVGFLPSVRALQLPFFVFLGKYNSFIDLLVAVTLGFGMVVLVLEDAKHAADDAHAELTAAHEALRRSSVQDVLTGALTRRAFHDSAVRAALASGAVVLVDLDNLKVVNDAHGHTAGDRLLAHFAATLLRGVPPDAQVYRWGGDEFVVVMPGATPDRAELTVAGLLDAAEPLDIDGERVRLAASLGVARYTSGTDIERAVDTADASMYADKLRRKGTPVRPMVAIANAS
jgi:diguanylate cyclase (GGDEF)-like protein